MKLHLCAGDVYLAGYCNCDIDGILVGEGETVTNPTDLDHYYRDRQLGHKQAAVIDRRMDLAQMPWDFADASIDEIVMVNGIEHFPRHVAQSIVNEARRVLKAGGRFLVDVFGDFDGRHEVERAVKVQRLLQVARLDILRFVRQDVHAPRIDA